MKFKTYNEEYIDEVEKQIQNLGYKLIEFKTSKQENKRILVVIYNDNGITHKDCSIVSSKLNDFFQDKYNSYYLEVSSPGIERELKSERELRVFLGKRIKVVFEDDNKTYYYKLKDFKNNCVHLQSDDENISEIIIDKIKKIRLFP